ncbi:MAG: class I SAM-dependent methyltransferase [Ignavibacteria bacterium]|nr:class I SAM-dependent methyltransferase [Ignavibacteria bacterium]
MMKTDFSDNIFGGIISFYSIVYTPKKYIDRIFREFYRILRHGGKLLVTVKKGESEGITDDAWYEGNEVYFSYFLEDEIKGFFKNNKFELDFFDVRKPYDFEMNVERIYAIGTKK